MAMTRRTRALTVLTVLVVAAVALAASPSSVWAHPRLIEAVDLTPAPALPVTAPEPLPGPISSGTTVSPLILAGLLIVGLGLTLAARRRAIVVALALVLIVLAVETGVHSVHHLTDQKGGAECVVALASAHVHATAEPPAAVHDPWAGGPVDTVVAPAPERPGARPLRPDEGRAPPAA